MAEQSSQEDNKINNYILQNPIGQRQAQQLHTKMMKSMCNFFQPYKQYFHHYPVHYLVQPQGVYIKSTNSGQKVKLSTQRQMQYLRGFVRSHIDEQLMQKILKQQKYDRGFVENHQNKSMMIGCCYVYVDGYKLLGLMLNMPNINDKTTLSINYTFAEPIFQIRQYLNAYILVRCRYWIHVYQYANNVVVTKIRLKQQITSFRQFQHESKILISTYEHDKHRLYQWNCFNNTIVCLRTSSSFYPIHSMVYLNTRQFILGQSNKIFIQDLRCQDRETLKRVTQIGNDRFCSILPVEGKNNQIILSRSKFIDIFDIRKSNHNIMNVRHFCQESPPSCLLSFNWINPVIVAFSPHQLGSTLLINYQNDSKQNTKSNYAYQQQSSVPLLLFDSGKVFQGLYPKSVAAVVANKTLQLIHIDSSNGICIQTLQKKGQFQIVHVRSSVISCYPKQPNRKWIQQKQISQFFNRRQDAVNSDLHSSSESSESQQQIQDCQQNTRRKINYCSLEKFHDRILQLSQVPRTNSLKVKQIQLPDTYISSYVQGEADQNLQEVIKSHQKNQILHHQISQDLLEYLEGQWKM